MKAYQMLRYGKKAQLQLMDVAKPVPQAGEVLIEVYATAINQLDSKIRDGEFKLLLPYKPPCTLGHDVAGVITAAGSGVTSLRVGDEVYARPADFHIGTFAEFVAVPAIDVAHKPTTITMAEAASLPLVALTAWQALVERMQIQPGQRVFIQAGSGGVGTVAIQLAKHLGASVATTTSTANTELVRQLGADVVIDYRTQDFEQQLHDYDGVLNSQADKTLKKSLRVLRHGGTAVSISGPPDPAFARAFGYPWYVRLITRLLSRSVRSQAEKLGVKYSFLFMKANGPQLAHIARLVEAGAIRPVVDRVFSFAQLPEALAYVESGRAKGKVVVQVK